MAIGTLEVSKYEVLTDAQNELVEHYSGRVPDIGEPFIITEVFKVLKNVKGIIDVTDVVIRVKSGGDYSNVFLDVDRLISSDGRLVELPKNVIYEIRFPVLDIKGSVI